MHRANGREKGNAYRFKPRARDAPSTEEVPGPSSSSGGGNDAKAVKPRVPVKPGQDGKGGATAADNPRKVAPKVVLGGAQGHSLPSSAKGQGSPRVISCRQLPTAQVAKLRPTSGQGTGFFGTDPKEKDEGWQVQRSRVSLASSSRKLEASSSQQKGLGSKDGPSNHSTGQHPKSTPGLIKITIKPDSVMGARQFKNPLETREPEATTPKKIKKKKNVSKEEKQRRRDEAGLKELFKPKDSRVTLLDSELFQKIKGNSTSSPISCGVFQFSATPLNAQHAEFPPPAPCRNSVNDFPTLDGFSAGSTPQVKSFAAAAASPIIPCLVATQRVPESATSLHPPPPSIPVESVAKPQPQPKLSKRAITVNLSDMIQSATSRNAAGNLVSNRQISRNKYERLPDRIRDNYKLTVGNILDSSGPVVIRRGKIRMKKKKASRLKKGILRSREMRKNASIPQPPPTISEEPTVENSPSPTTPTLEQVTEQLNEIRVQDSTPNVDSISNGISSLTLDSSETEPLPSNKDSLMFSILLQEAEDSTKPPAPLPSAAIEVVKLALHSRKFRPYCDMFVTKELHGLVIPLMTELHRLQDRIYKTDPKKLVIKRRFVNGMKEVGVALRLRKAQLVILAPDIEPNSGNGGLDDKTMEIISLAQENRVPYLFSGNRYILGRCIKQTKSPVSTIAILDKQSCEEQFNKVIEAAEVLRAQYQEEFSRRLQDVMANGG